MMSGSVGVKIGDDLIPAATPIAVVDRAAVMGPSEALYKDLAVYTLPIELVAAGDQAAADASPIYVHPSENVSVVVLGPGMRAKVHDAFTRHAGNMVALRAESARTGPAGAAEGARIQPNNFILTRENKCAACGVMFATPGNANNLCSSCSRLMTALGRVPTSADVAEVAASKTRMWEIAADHILARGRCREKLVDIRNFMLRAASVPACAAFFADVKRRWGEVLMTAVEARALVETIGLRAPESEMIDYQHAIFCRVVDFWNLREAHGVEGQFYRPHPPLPPPGAAFNHVTLLLVDIARQARNVASMMRVPPTLDSASVLALFGPFKGETDPMYAGPPRRPVEAAASSSKRGRAEGGVALCVICRTDEAVRACVPCGHLCFCEDDSATYVASGVASGSLICPICRAALSAAAPTIHVYKP
jgi:hypothetical protein